MVSRVAAIVLIFVLGAGYGGATEGPETLSEPIPNWPAPLFWSPSASVSEDGDLLKAGVPTPALPFVGITPCRLVDTRPSQGFPPAWGPPALVANATRDFDLNSAPHCAGVPANAEAYSLNVTVTETQGAGDIRMWPTGTPPLVVSTQNWPAALMTLANAVIVPAGTGGAVTVQVAGSGTHVIIDINGYFGGAVTEVQQRVTGTCASGSSIRIIAADGSVTCESDDTGGAAAWSLTGNSGTTPTVNFLGTTDDQPLEIRVNGQRAVRLEPTAIVTQPNVILGNRMNAITSGVTASVIGGGGADGLPNRVTDRLGTVAGGNGNRAGDDAGTTTDQEGATVSGGVANVASGGMAAVSGGLQNTASGFGSLVAGGGGNDAVGDFATVIGGSQNLADADVSLAAGNQAKALHTGAFVWADSSVFDFQSTADNQFNVRAVGGSRFVSAINGSGIPTAGVELAAGGNAWAPLSDRAAKENFREVNEEELLERLAAIPVETWNLKSQDPSIRHIGPMAQDFAAAFGVGEYDNRITTSDADGVAFAAIQALYTKLRERDRRIEELERRLSALEAKEFQSPISEAKE